MQGQRIPGDRPERPRQFAIQRAVLGTLLERHPEPIAVDQLVGDLGEDFDAVVVAIMLLEHAGLVRCRDDLVSPTQAAVRFDELGL